MSEFLPSLDFNLLQGNPAQQMFPGAPTDPYANASLNFPVLMGNPGGNPGDEGNPFSNFFFGQGAEGFGTLLAGGAGIFNAYNGVQNQKLMEDNLEFQKLAYMLDTERQAQGVMNQAEDQALKRIGAISPKERQRLFDQGFLETPEDARAKNDFTTRGVVRRAASDMKDRYNLNFDALV